MYTYMYIYACVYTYICLNKLLVTLQIFDLVTYIVEFKFYSE